MNNSLLIRGNPIVFNAELAVAIGLNEAIILQKIAFLLDRTESGKVLDHDGERWLFNTYEAWQEQFFPFLSVKTIQRTFLELERKGLLVSCQPEGRISRRKYYRIGEGAARHLVSERLAEQGKMTPLGTGQNDSSRNRAKWGLPFTVCLTENTTDTHAAAVNVCLDSDKLEAIYQVYPRKAGKPSALRAIKQALKRHAYEDLLQKTKAYAEAVAAWPKDSRQYVPYPATWFNDERFNDPVEGWQRGGGKGVPQLFEEPVTLV